jgi:Flp pilus assembly protein TadG
MRRGRSVFQGYVGRARRAGQDVRGAQLLEVALVLPLLLLLAVGILDFGTAYNLRQILNNAAREGARVGAAQPRIDVNCAPSCPTNPPPASVQAVHNDVVTYLKNASVDTSFIDASSTYTPTNATWTYACNTKSATLTCGPVATALTIQRTFNVIDPNTGKSLTTTRVTLSYPYNWIYGFNNIIGFFGVKYGGTIAITTDALMQDQS